MDLFRASLADHNSGFDTRHVSSRAEREIFSASARCGARSRFLTELGTTTTANPSVAGSVVSAKPNLQGTMNKFKLLTITCAMALLGACATVDDLSLIHI